MTPGGPNSNEKAMIDQAIEKNGRRTRNLRKKGLEEKELFQTKKIRKGGRK